MGRFSAIHSVLWERGRSRPIEIGDFGGVAWNTPMAINQRGDVVGFANASEADGGLVVRSSERHAITSGWSKAAVEAVSPLAAPARLEVISITLEPGGRSGKHPYAHPREEFAFVLRGRVRLTLGPEEHELHAGDAASILPGELRLWRNDSRSSAQVLIVTSKVAGPRRRAVPARRRAVPTRTSRR